MALEDQLSKAVAETIDPEEKDTLRDVYAFFEEQRIDMARNQKADQLKGMVMVIGYDLQGDVGVQFTPSWSAAEDTLRKGDYHPHSPVILYEFRVDYLNGPRLTGYGKILRPEAVARMYVDPKAGTRILPRHAPA